MDSTSAFKNLNHIPWALDGRAQPFAELLRTLENETARFQEQPQKVKFSLLTPMWKTHPKHIEELIWSCQAQTYAHWELILQDDGSPTQEHLAVARKYAALDPRIQVHINAKNMGISGGRNEAIKNATGDFLAILDHDDLLHPQILGIYAQTLAQNPAINFIFSNECKITEDSSRLCDFFHKPCFDIQTLLRTNYICHFTAIRRDVYEAARTPEGDYYLPKYDGVEDHEFFLRCALQTKIHAHHVPFFGYYWRISATSTAGDLGNKPWVIEMGKNMVAEKAAMIYGSPEIQVQTPDEKKSEKFLRLSFKKPATAKIAVIIPFRDKSRITLRCLERLEEQNTAHPLEVILVDNDSQESELKNISDWIKHSSRKHQYKLNTVRKPFNYGQLNNMALAQLGEDISFILLLNNDVALSDRDTITSMATTLAADENIAHCSIRLHFPGTTSIQYGGVEFADKLVGSGYFLPHHMTHYDRFAYDDHTLDISGFACCMIKQSALKKVGLLDENNFANGLGDVEWCLRAKRHHLRGFYLGSIVGEHAESHTRLANAEDLQLGLLHLTYGGEIFAIRSEQIGFNNHLVINTQGLDNLIDQPLRYKAADFINDALKKTFGPLHKVIKQFAKKKVLG